MHKNPMYLQFKETKSFGSCLHFLSSVGAFICYCFVLSEVMGQVVSVKSPVTPINGQDFRCWKKKTTQKMIHWAKTCGVFLGGNSTNHCTPVRPPEHCLWRTTLAQSLFVTGCSYYMQPKGALFTNNYALTTMNYICAAVRAMCQIVTS